MNLIEMAADDQHDSPCVYGNIVDGHACYCHHPDGPRKCPIWKYYGEHDRERWHDRGNWDNDDWDGGCRLFEGRE